MKGLNKVLLIGNLGSDPEIKQLEGKPITRSYDDKSGNKKYVTEIIADQIILLDKKES